MPLRDNAVKILMEKGADPNTRDSEGRNALMVMSMDRRSEASAEFQLRPILMRAPPPPPPELPVEVVVSSRPVPITVYVEPDKALQSIGETLLKAGCDINAADSMGRTPLMYAARYAHPTAVRLLLGAGASVNAKDNEGMTALDLAKKTGNQDVIKLLKSANVRSAGAKK